MSFLTIHLLVSLFLNTRRLSIVTKMNTKLEHKPDNRTWVLNLHSCVADVVFVAGGLEKKTIIFFLMLHDTR